VEGADAAETPKAEEGAPPLPKTYPFSGTYPPKYVLGGFKVEGGRAVIEGLRLPEDVPAGEYQLQIGEIRIPNPESRIPNLIPESRVTKH
jgi:hypothetical protein